MSTNETIQNLEQLKADLANRIEAIEKTILELKTFSVYQESETSESRGKSANSGAGYNRKSSLRKKVAFIFSQENRFLHARQIAEYLHEHEPKISITDFRNQLSPALGFLRRNKVIDNVKVGKSNVNIFWGSVKWLDKDGNILEGHGYDKNQVKEFGSEEIKI